MTARKAQLHAVIDLSRESAGRIQPGTIVIPRDRSGKSPVKLLMDATATRKTRVTEPREVIRTEKDSYGVKYVHTRGLVTGHKYRAIMYSRISAKHDGYPRDYWIISQRTWAKIGADIIRVFELRHNKQRQTA